MSNSIWGCIEMDAISRNLSHKEYYTLHTITDCKGAKLSLHSYSLLNEIFYISLLENNQKESEGDDVSTS